MCWAAASVLRTQMRLSVDRVRAHGNLAQRTSGAASDAEAAAGDDDA